MSTLYVKAEDLKDFNIAEIDIKGIEIAQNLASSVSKFYPAHVVCRVYNDGGRNYMQEPQVALKTASLTILISYNQYCKKFNIYCPDIYTLPQVARNHVNDTIRFITEPNQIGVLTTNKINAWVTYWYEAYAQVQAKNNERTNKIEAFMKSLEGQNVEWFKNKTAGEIKKGGLIYKFSISDGYISESIDKDFNLPTSLASFIKMSDNKVTKEDCKF